MEYERMKISLCFYHTLIEHYQSNESRISKSRFLRLPEKLQQELGFTLNEREFRDAIKLRYDWPIDDLPSTCVCGGTFTVDHAMIRKQGRFITQRHNDLRDLEAELLTSVCSDVEIEPPRYFR